MKKVVTIFMLLLAATHVSCATKIYPECLIHVDDPEALESCQAETKEYKYIEEVQRFHEMCDWCRDNSETVIYLYKPSRSYYGKSICDLKRPPKFDMRSTQCVDRRALMEALQNAN